MIRAQALALTLLPFIMADRWGRHGPPLPALHLSPPGRFGICYDVITQARAMRPPRRSSTSLAHVLDHRNIYPLIA